MALEGSRLPAQRYQVELFTSATAESDPNTWMLTVPGPLGNIYLAHGGTDPMVMVLCCPGP